MGDRGCAASDGDCGLVRVCGFEEVLYRYRGFSYSGPFFLDIL